MTERFEKFSYAIAEISRCWHKLTADELSKYGLKGSHATYLTALYRHEEGITAPQLCRLCGRDKADVSRMVSIMESKGLVVKESANRNMYRGLIKLTEKGKALASHICERASLATELAGSELSDEDRNTFYNALDTISKHLREFCERGIPAK